MSVLLELPQRPCCGLRVSLGLRANSLQSFARAADAAGWRAAGVAAALPAPLPLPVLGSASAPPLHCAVLRATAHGALLALVDGDSLRLLRWSASVRRRCGGGSRGRGGGR